LNSPDPASLQNLNDIVVPAATGWWPLAPGWYFLSGFILIAMAWFSYRAFKRWRRRSALQELQLVEKEMQIAAKRDSSLRQVPILLKRTALSAYPRNEVASLTGESWHDFLNSTVRQPAFTDTAFSTLETVSYNSGQLSSVDDHAAIAMVDASRHWLQHHVLTSRDDRGVI
jgi:hypothetical protein